MERGGGWGRVGPGFWRRERSQNSLLRGLYSWAMVRPLDEGWGSGLCNQKVPEGTG